MKVFEIQNDSGTRLNEMTRPDQNISQINLVSRIDPDSRINPVSRINPDSRINPNSRINSPIRPTFNIPLTRPTENIPLTRPTDSELPALPTDSELPTLPTDFEEQTGDVITFAQFEEGIKISETCNNTESGDKSDSESIMMSEKDMENIDETEKFDDDLISTETLHDIRDGNQTHPKIDKREARMAIRDHI